MPERKINLMHAVLSLEVGGMERFVAEHSMLLDRDLFNVQVCCFDNLGPFAEPLREKGISVTLLKKNQDHFDYFYPFRFARFLRAHNVDILHMHSGAFFLAAVAGFLARTAGSVYTDHGRHMVDPLKLLLMDRVSACFTDRIVAVSGELQKYLVEVVKLPQRKTETIINGIDCDKYRPRAKSKKLLDELGIPAVAKVVGTVGRLADVKDHATLIKVFAEVRASVPESYLVLVGDGPNLSKLKELVSTCRLDSRVKFLGERGDVAELLNLFDVFVLSSLSEGTSLALLEAMASGVPPIVTAVGGNPAVVGRLLSEYVVPPRDVDSIRDAIVQLLTDGDKWQVSRELSVERVRQNYSINKMMSCYGEIYADIIKRKKLLS